MPTLNLLSISGVRNIESADLELSDGVNFFHGSNGAGKTTVLEAVNILSEARSFRSSKYKSLVKNGNDFLEVVGAVSIKSNAILNRESLRIGVRRSLAGKDAIRINGESTKSAASLSRNLPLVVINSRLFQLVEGGSAVRRSFLDRAVFHVKHSYLGHYRKFQTLLQQRNKLLKRSDRSRSELAGWDAQLVDVSTILDADRRAVFEGLSKAFSALLTTFNSDLADAITLEFYSGWEGSELLGSSLLDNYEKDSRYGHTSVGPHRADIKIRADGATAHELLSRGQIKLVALALKLAEGGLIADARQDNPVLLLDDLPSEFDKDVLERIGEWLNQTGCQSFVSATDRKYFDFFRKNAGTGKMFHVKQGCVTPDELD